MSGEVRYNLNGFEIKSKRLDTARVLRHLGLRDQIHPRDALASAFPDLASFEDSARRDRDLNGNDVHGPFVSEAGIVGIADIRPQLARRGIGPTPPGLPDDYGAQSPLIVPGAWNDDTKAG